MGHTQGKVIVAQASFGSPSTTARMRIWSIGRPVVFVGVADAVRRGNVAREGSLLFITDRGIFLAAVWDAMATAARAMRDPAAV